MEAPLGWNKAFVITPDDAVNLPLATQAIYVGGTGNITGVLPDGSTVLISAIPVGAQIPVQFKRINATGTTATLIVGLAMV